MSPEMICLLCIGFLLVLLGMGMPISFSMGIVGFTGYVLIDGLDCALSMLAFIPWQSLAVYCFTVIPMFVFMGMLAGEVGFGEDVFFVVRKWVGRIPGSLAISSCLGCAAFGSLSGDAISSTITMGKIAVLEMEKSGYDIKLDLASVASASPIAAMIPPSILICVYGMITE